MKHFLDIHDFSSKELLTLIELAYSFKHESFKSSCLNSKSVGLIFEKPSLRTRVSFEVGIKQLGGHSIVLQKNEIGLGNREPIKDISRVLSRYLDLIMIRTYDHNTLKEFASCSAIPVINGLTDYSHPCQVIADFLTILEQFSSFNELKFCYMGDGNNVSRSLVELCYKLGIRCVLSTPEENKLKSDTPYFYEKNPVEAVSGAHIVYSDTWVSMGESKKLLDVFASYQVNSNLMSYADENAIFLHCLPAHRGEEVTNDVMESSFSKVFDQAENRLHAQKAIMHTLMTSLLV